MVRLSLSLFLIDRLLAGYVLLCCFAFKFVGVLLQTILVGRLGKAGRQTTGALGFGATLSASFLGSVMAMLHDRPTTSEVRRCETRHRRANGLFAQL